MKQSKNSIRNKRILIAGFSGSIGEELTRQLCKNNKVFGIDLDETRSFDLVQDLQDFWVKYRVGDIRNKDTVGDVFSDFKPQIVINAAAYKHVSPMEHYPREAVETNILGNLNLLEESIKWECLEKYIFISTDKVVNASSIMGATKKVSEIIVKNQGGIVVRFGNVLGSRGSVIPIWQRQADKGEPLIITDSRMERFFMTIEEACGLVVEAIKIGQGGEIIILDMKQPINIKNLAEAIIERSGRDLGLKEIGIRPGEQLKEELMTTEERQRAIKQGKFWVIK